MRPTPRGDVHLQSCAWCECSLLRAACYLRAMRQGPCRQQQMALLQCCKYTRWNMSAKSHPSTLAYAALLPPVWLWGSCLAGGDLFLSQVQPYAFLGIGVFAPLLKPTHGMSTLRSIRHSSDGKLKPYSCIASKHSC